MAYRHKFSLFLFCWFANCAEASSIPASTESEIDALLKFIAQTPCIITRNGEKHAGSEAVKHVEKKYHYFSDKISSAEDFIRYSASGSTLTGRDYTVDCPDGYRNTTRVWLLEQLANIRNTKGAN